MKKLTPLLFLMTIVFVLPISAQNNVGVGIGTPLQKLHVFGNLKITNSGGSDGKLFIGTTMSDEANQGNHKLLIGGSALMTELKIELTTAWPDYVFKKDYQLLPLHDLESFIKTEGHLPGIPSASQVEADNGFMVGEVQRKMLEKIEELTLYMIDLKKDNESLRKEVDDLKASIEDKK